MAGADIVDTANTARRVRELQALLNHHSALYYAGKPEIPDADFDDLLVELRNLEERHPELVHPDSPTRRVGAPPDTAFAPVRHEPPMMSLHNALDLDELRAWNERVHRALAASTRPMVEQALPTLAASTRPMVEQALPTLANSGGQHRVGLRGRAEVRWPGHFGPVRGRRAGAGRHPGRRPHRRGRHPLGANHRRHPDPPEGADPRGVGGARRGHPASLHLRETQRPPDRARREGLRQPPQRGRGLPATEGRPGDGRAGSVVLVLPARARSRTGRPSAPTSRRWNGSSRWACP